MKLLLNVALAIFLAFSVTTPAAAQRGAMRPGSPSSFKTPNQGYPGFFDTNMAEHGSLVVEWPPLLLPFLPIPSIAVDYGVSETLTIGTNALITTVPWILGAKGISLKARTLVYGTESLQSAATIYGGYVSAAKLASTWQVFTSNTAWKLAPRHVISGQMMFMNFGVELGTETDLDYTNIRFATTAVGGGYQFLLSNETSISSYILAAVANSVEADTVSANLSADLNATSGDSLWGVARVSGDFKSGDWLYSIGGVYMHGFFGRVMPWFSATRKW